LPESDLVTVTRWTKALGMETWHCFAQHALSLASTFPQIGLRTKTSE
jgi:hypothetical protein